MGFLQFYELYFVFINQTLTVRWLNILDLEVRWFSYVYY